MQNNQCCDCEGGSCHDDSNDALNIKDLKTRSKALTGTKNNDDWMKRAAARAMMRGAGWKDEDFEKPLIAVAAPYTNITPCNTHIKELNEIICKEIENVGATYYSFGTPVITDGQSMNMEGMKYSLPSRDLIADCIEMMYEGYSGDALITLCGCDKTIPAALMPLARANATGIVLYGGTILPGDLNGKALDIVSIFEAIGAKSAGKMSDEEFHQVECNACPTPGACGGMYTANTMAMAIEAMGMSLPGSASNPATNYSRRISEEKYQDCIDTVYALLNLMKLGIKTRDILTKKAFENAITVVMATTGSTNAVLHLLAIANEAGVDLTLDDFQRINENTPIIADLRPSGKYVMYDLFKIGGTGVVMKQLLNAGLLHGDCLTVTGKTLAENLASIPDELPANQDLLYTVEKPFVKAGHHIIILKGNIAPEGCVFKQSGKYLMDKSHTGPARVFEDEISATTAILDGKINKGDVVVIRYEGPKGGPGMREMLSPTSAIAGRGLVWDVPLITDGRFSGGSHGIDAAHITPEAFEGGPIAAIKEGDMITIDPSKKLLHLHVEDEVIAERLSQWSQPKPKYTRGVLAKYAKIVKSAKYGAITN
jgi:dihydroxy-acid dehydratase